MAKQMSNIFEIDENEDETEDIKIVERFKMYILKDPIATINEDDVRTVFTYLRDRSNLMIQKSARCSWLVAAVDNDDFVLFYLRYIQLLCDTTSADYLSKPRNQALSNFIKLQMLVWNVTDKLDEMCFKLAIKEIPYHLLQLLTLPQLHPSVCLSQNNARLTVHSSIGVLHNLINHVPKIRGAYRLADGVRVLSLYVTSLPDDRTVADQQTTVHYLSLRTAALLVLSFLVDEDENKKLHADDSHIVYMLRALEDALNHSNTLYSTKYGYQAEELLVAVQNLAGPDQNKRSLIRNEAIKLIWDTLLVASKLKNPYTPVNTKVPVISVSATVGPDRLAELALNFLWSLSFVPESHPELASGSAFRRFFERFSSDSCWSAGCRRVCQGILWNLALTNSTNFHPSDSPDTIASLMSQERRQPRRHGHLMISYQHSTKNMMIMVRDQLIAMGYTVWMDVDYMRGSFVDAMAQGIQDASGMILGLSQAFKNSPHCRQEVKYAYNLDLPLFPLQLEPNFCADGWLGFLVATLIYIPMTDESMVKNAIVDLSKQLGDIGHRSRAASEEAVPCTDLLSTSTMSDTRNTNVLVPTPSTVDQSLSIGCAPFMTLNGASRWSPVNTWKPDVVSHWLEDNKLGAYCSQLASLDGSMLVELIRLRNMDPGTLLTSVCRELGMSVIDQLQLLSALAKLNQTNPTIS